MPSPERRTVIEKDEDNIKEKRDYLRMNKLCLISYIIKEGGRQISPVSMGRALDLSRSGVRVEVFQRINVGSEMEIRIALGNKEFSVNGTVVRSLEIGNKVYILGIQFDEVSTELIDSLKPETFKF